VKGVRGFDEHVMRGGLLSLLCCFRERVWQRSSKTPLENKKSQRPRRARTEDTLALPHRGAVVIALVKAEHAAYKTTSPCFMAWASGRDAMTEHKKRRRAELLNLASPRTTPYQLFHKHTHTIQHTHSTHSTQPQASRTPAISCVC
jgi:hypothetical protein